MENKMEEEVLARRKAAHGTFDREAYHLDEGMQDVLWKRQRLGITGSMSTEEGVLMPAKARSTLVGPSRKRSRAEKSA